VQARVAVVSGAAAGATIATTAIVVAHSFSGADRVDVRVEAPSTASETPPLPTIGPVTTVTVFGYVFELPDGFIVTSEPTVYDLTHADPPQPVGGKTASFTLRNKVTGASFDLTVYRGPIAGAERQAQPPSPQLVEQTTIVGYPATFDPYARRGGNGIVPPAETRVEIGPDEEIFVNTERMALGEIRSVLESGLGG
jgi:hypothetical protein